MNLQKEILNLKSASEKIEYRHNFISLLINGAVITFIGSEIFAVMSGHTGAGKLLMVSIVSGAMTIISYNLSKKALWNLNENAESDQSEEIN